MAECSSAKQCCSLAVAAVGEGTTERMEASSLAEGESIKTEEIKIEWQKKLNRRSK